MSVDNMERGLPVIVMAGILYRFSLTQSG